MAAKIDENTQFTGIDGKPLTNGKIYIGSATLDPVLNPITIYSDRALSVVLANPQTLDGQGRPTNKIWIPERYSLRVDDEDAVQQLIDLDAGEFPESGITGISNVQGTNAITGQANPGITSYVDQEQYTFAVANENTGAVTVNFDSVGVKPVKRNFDQDIVKGQFKQNQIVILTYNATADVFEWTNQNFRVDYWTKGADIVSAPTIDLSLATGNAVTITGNTGPITAFGTTPAGSIFYLTFNSTPTLTHNGTSLKLPSEANIVVVAGDRMILKSLGSGNWECVNYTRIDGKAVIETPGAFETALLHIQDQKTTGTDGGTFTLGAERTRDLNTVLTNEISGASLSTNQITLPAGDYYIEALAPAWGVAKNRLLLRDTTGAADLLVGISGGATSTDLQVNNAALSGRFTLSEESVLELQHRCSFTNATDGFGQDSNFGPHEVYTDVKIWKLP